MSEANLPVSAAPLVLTDQGHFFTGLRTHPGPAGTSVYGTHVEYQTPESVRDNLVLVHGGGGQALDMLTTPDGRPGWSTIFLRDGFAVYTVDRPGLGRSPFHPDVYGPYGPPAAYEGFVASFAGPAPPGLPPHTQWPGSGDRDDPALATFLAWQEPFPPDAVVSAECSGFEPSCHATADYLRSCGAAVDEIRLGDLGVHGNGHAMMLEKNNAEVAAVITDWIVKHT